MDNPTFIHEEFWKVTVRASFKRLLTLEKAKPSYKNVSKNFLTPHLALLPPLFSLSSLLLLGLLTKGT